MHWTNCRPLDESTPGIKSCVKREKGEKEASTIANFSTSRSYFRSRTVYFVRDYGMYLFYRQTCSLPQFTIYAYNKTDYIKFPLLFSRMLNHITAAMTLLTKNHLKKVRHTGSSWKLRMQYKLLISLKSFNEFLERSKIHILMAL